MNQTQRIAGGARAHRPASLDIGMARRCPIGCSRIGATLASPPTVSVTTPSSAPAACTSRGFFDDCTTTTTTTAVNNGNVINNGGNGAPGFELNVNVACSPAGNRDFRTAPSIGACKRSDLIVEPRPHYAEPLLAVGKAGAQIDHTRSYTSVSLTLRPPSSEPQAPIDIRSQGSSLTYSSSSLDPRGFQSRLQISIGPGSVGSVAAARIRPPMGPNRPNSLIPPPVQTGPQRPPGLPAGPPSQLPRPTTTMSAPTTPSVPTTTNIVPPSSLPTTPSGPTTTSPPSSPSGERIQTSSDQKTSPLNQVAEHQRKLVAEQLARKERLAKELRAEKGRLEAMKKELQSLARPFDSSISPQELKRKLRSEIYQLQVECDRLTEEVDQWSDPRVPLGETNEEFYQGIYTGQPFLPGSFNPQIPPLPSQPPAWQPEPVGNDIDREERDGPSWVCRMCTFDNHPLMNKCEQCDMPRLLDHGNTGTTRPKFPEEPTTSSARFKDHSDSMPRVPQ